MIYGLWLVVCDYCVVVDELYSLVVIYVNDFIITVYIYDLLL